MVSGLREEFHFPDVALGEPAADGEDQVGDAADHQPDHRGGVGDDQLGGHDRHIALPQPGQRGAHRDQRADQPERRSEPGGDAELIQPGALILDGAAQQVLDFGFGRVPGEELLQRPSVPANRERVAVRRHPAAAKPFGEHPAAFEENPDRQRRQQQQHRVKHTARQQEEKSFDSGEKVHDDSAFLFVAQFQQETGGGGDGQCQQHPGDRHQPGPRRRPHRPPRAQRHAAPDEPDDEGGRDQQQPRGQLPKQPPPRRAGRRAPAASRPSRPR
ncbi:hypothetical protein SDC9_154090 [bioreactor metagenome]|uniref:Uncharacterized protein n=1 Tax=bioreactor metagenome TaxID=1076179 RepID=A0A645F2G3_9ZZZZ